MARKTETRLIDDLDGSTADETVTFGLDGIIYEIDLNDEHAAALREKFSELIDHATRVGGRAKRGSRPANNGENKKIRAWAQENGYEIGDRGRISAEIREAYKAGTPAPAAEKTESAPSAPAKDANTGRFVSTKDA